MQRGSLIPWDLRKAGQKEKVETTPWDPERVHQWEPRRGPDFSWALRSGPKRERVHVTKTA
eukprot:4492913-Ditylum_brightwellii.AAC.1